MMAALAALNTCMSDPGGAIRRRIPVLLVFTLLGALVVSGVGLARGLGIAVALPIGVLGLFCATFVRIYGQTSQMLGVLLGVLLILSLDRPVTDVAHAAVLAAAFIGGGLWATLLTLVIWPINSYQPARRAVAQVYLALATTAENFNALLRTGNMDEAAWDAHAAADLGHARTAIENAREAVTEIQRARGGPSEEVRHGAIRLESAEQLLGALIALGDTLQRDDARRRDLAQDLLGRLRSALLALDQSVATGSETNREVDGSIAAMAALAASLPERDVVRAIVGTIVEQLRIAVTLSVPANFLPGAELDGTPPSLHHRLWQPLRENLVWQSPALRHALRLTAATAPSLAFTMLWFTPYDHWLTITIAMTMQPYFGLTYTRVLQRIAGTVAGGLVAALIGVVCTTPIAVAAAMFPLAMVALSARTLAYGLFITWLTPLIVLLVDISEPGASEWMVAGLRALFTVIGGAASVVACFLLWPNFEPERLLQEMRDAIAAQGRYAVAVLSNLLGEATAIVVERSRREAGLSSNRLEASISRTLIERGPGSQPTLRAATLIDAALRRCGGRMTAIMLDPTMRTALPASTWRDWREWIAKSSASLATGGAQLAPRPAPAIEAVARVGRQFELISGALERLPG